jgi:aminomethyltransferase
LGKRTFLYKKHLTASAKIIDFAGWDMPIHYGSQIEEHHIVRRSAGVFDVSHMTIVDVSGRDSRNYLQYLLSNDVGKLTDRGQALYSAMLNHDGYILDDLIVYRMSFGFRVVVNCATREKDLRWMIQNTDGFRVSVQEKPKLAILAVNGPDSIQKFCEALAGPIAEEAQKLLNFQGQELDACFIARTGYTGEQGLEVILPEEDAPEFWDKFLKAGIKPAGLGARDTLRLEAGMNLYGQDMDETTSPLSANMDRTIAYTPAEREFIGKPALIAHKALYDAGKAPELKGLVLESRGILRTGQTLITDQGEGIVTSGGFSPTLKHSIALARIPSNSKTCKVDLRGTPTPVRIVKPNFVRFGKKIFE